MDLLRVVVHAGAVAELPREVHRRRQDQDADDDRDDRDRHEEVVDLLGVGALGLEGVLLVALRRAPREDERQHRGRGDEAPARSRATWRHVPFPAAARSTAESTDSPARAALYRSGLRRQQLVAELVNSCNRVSIRGGRGRANDAASRAPPPPWSRGRRASRAAPPAPPAPRAGLLQHRSPTPDDDALLGLALDQDPRPDAPDLVVGGGRVVGVLDLLGDDRDRVGQLVPGHAQELLADELRGDEQLGLVGHGPVGVILRPLGHPRLELPHERVDAEAGPRRQRHVGVEFAQLCGGAGEVVGNSRAVGDVDLVHHEQLRGVDLLHELGHEAVTTTDGCRRLDEQAHRVHLREGRAGALVRALTEQGPRLVDAGRVEQHDLAGGGRAHPTDLAACRLWPVGDDRHLRADDPVDEGRLPDVRPADEGDEARVERHRPVTTPVTTIARPRLGGRVRRRRARLVAAR